MMGINFTLKVIPASDSGTGTGTGTGTAGENTTSTGSNKASTSTSFLSNKYLFAGIIVAVILLGIFIMRR